MPPMFSTAPLASARSVPSAAFASSVSTSWNFTEELPQLRTRTFTRPFYLPAREPPVASDGGSTEPGYRATVVAMTVGAGGLGYAPDRPCILARART